MLLRKFKRRIKVPALMCYAPPIHRMYPLPILNLRRLERHVSGAEDCLTDVFVAVVVVGAVDVRGMEARLVHEVESILAHRHETVDLVVHGDGVGLGGCCGVWEREAAKESVLLRVGD